MVGKEAAKLGLKKGAVYVAKQAGMIAVTQAGMSFVLHPLAEKYNISETQLRIGLAAIQALTMHKAFTKPGAKIRCKKISKTANSASGVPKGGTYVLRDPVSGKVIRTGRTNNLNRRRLEHRRYPQTKDLQFKVDKRTNNYQQQRGREQIIHDHYNPPMNKNRPIDPRNPERQNYMDAARELGD